MVFGESMRFFLRNPPRLFLKGRADCFKRRLGLTQEKLTEDGVSWAPELSPSLGGMVRAEP